MARGIVVTTDVVLAIGIGVAFLVAGRPDRTTGAGRLTGTIAFLRDRGLYVVTDGGGVQLVPGTGRTVPSADDAAPARDEPLLAVGGPRGIAVVPADAACLERGTCPVSAPGSGPLVWETGPDALLAYRGPTGIGLVTPSAPRPAPSTLPGTAETRPVGFTVDGSGGPCRRSTSAVQRSRWRGRAPTPGRVAETAYASSRRRRNSSSSSRSRASKPFVPGS